MQANHLDPIFMSVSPAANPEERSGVRALEDVCGHPRGGFCRASPRISGEDRHRLKPPHRPSNPLVVAAFTAQPVPASLNDVAAIYTNSSRVSNRRHKPTSMPARPPLPGSVQGFDAPTVATHPSAFRHPCPPRRSRPLPCISSSLACHKLFTNKLRFNFPKINELELTHPGAPARAMVVADAPKPQDSPVFHSRPGGDEGRRCSPAFPRNPLAGRKTAAVQRRKRAPGTREVHRQPRAIPSPRASMVNRVWMHHFGEGFVRTPDDLGTQSEPPSHPELLDYLANYFVENGWSLKKLHRLIMLSQGLPGEQRDHSRLRAGRSARTAFSGAPISAGWISKSVRDTAARLQRQTGSHHRRQTRQPHRRALQLPPLASMATSTAATCRN